MGKWRKRRPVSPFAGSKSATLEACEQYRRDMDGWRKSLPFPVRVMNGACRWLRYRVFGTYGFFRYKVSPRLVWRRTGWRLHRAKHGWAACDTWCADGYIARVMSQMLAHLAENTHSYPGYGEFDTFEKWQAHLRDMSARLAAWNDDTYAEPGQFETTRAAVEEFGKRFGSYWD